MRFQYKFKLDEQDYYQFNKHYSDNTFQSKKQNIIMRYVYPIVFLLVLGAIFLREFEITLAIVYILIFAIMYIVFSLFWSKAYKHIIDKRLRKAIHNMKESGHIVCDEMMFTFEDEFFVSKTPDVEAQSKYSVIQKIVIAESAVYVYIEATTAYIIPKSAFKDEYEINEFVSFIDSKICGGSNDNVQKG